MTFEDRFCNVGLDRNQFVADSIRELTVQHCDYETRNYVKGALWMWGEILQTIQFDNSYLRSLLEDLYDRAGLDKI